MLVGRCCPPKRQLGSGPGCGRGVRSAWKLDGRRQLPFTPIEQDQEGLPWGLPLWQSLFPSIHPGEQLVFIHCPLQRGAGGDLPFTSHLPRVVWLLGRLKAACWEAGSSRVSAMWHACHAWGFWVAQLRRGISKSLGQICPLSERGAKPTPSWADNDCFEVVNGKAVSFF